MAVPDRVACELISWEGAASLARKLAKIVIDSGYSPDLIVAVARGGFVPARVVCDYLLLNELASIRVEHWGIASMRSERARVVQPLSIPIRGKRVLVVDDVTDTGDTMAVILEYLHALEPREVRVGVLHHKISSRFMPDYVAEVQQEWRWIVYPWAVYEDLAGFVSRTLEEKAIDRRQIREMLQVRYGILVEMDLLDDVIALLRRDGKVGESDGSVHLIR